MLKFLFSSSYFGLKGDSGGGLYVLDTVNGQNKYIEVGIVSYGEDCALKGKPGIYTRISAFLDWINLYAWVQIYLNIPRPRLFKIFYLISPIFSPKIDFKNVLLLLK